MEIGNTDKKIYTLILKDEVLEKSPNGREQSTISWEYDFQARDPFSSRGEMLQIRWKDFKPMYRGKEKPDAKPLDLTQIKRISFMIRR